MVHKIVKKEIGEKDSIMKQEKDLLYESDSSKAPPDDVFSYNELRSCADLYRMQQEGILEIAPDFQRDLVWHNSDQTRFIDSLTKELPIPSLCFSLDAKTQKWRVIDGLQRVSTIKKFFDESTWKLSKLEDIDLRLSGETVFNIKKNHPELFRRIQNLTLPVTVLRCNYEKPTHEEYIFTIFHRLNTGGLKLTNQEIRNAIHQGPFNSLLKECNLNKDWRALFGAEKVKEDRYRKIELILRFLAFFDHYLNYRGKLTTFLNVYMKEHRFASAKEIACKKKLFEETVKLINEELFEGKRLSKTSNALIDALLLGVAYNLTSLQKKSSKEVKQMYQSMVQHPSFLEKEMREGIMKREKVLDRLNAAKQIFSGI